ncbi:hypothetical protein [Piscinibacter sp.]|uniref:hypothetical protein n=1 Tax=Piscinibacter sp. TaxID=1903157 RepID=UPI0039E42FB7
MKLHRIWFDPPHLRWGRVLWTVAIATALLALWLAQRRGLFDEPPPQHAAPPASPVASVVAMASRRAASAPIAAPAVAKASAPAAAASSVEIVCGLGEVSFDPNDQKQAERAAREALDKLEAHRQRVLPGWLEEMKSSTDEQVQAGAWFLETQREWVQRFEAGKGSAPLESLDELARLAERSRDPLPYALAFQACEMFRDRVAAPACAALRVESWAERDPSNAFVWISAAGQQGLDPARRSQYVERALAAESMRGNWGAMHRVLAKAAPPSEAPLDRSVRFFEGAAADAFVGELQVVNAHCGDAALRQGERRQQCERLAAFLADKGDSVLSITVGTGIGRRLGWSEDRLARYQREREALTDLLPPEIASSGCDGLARAEAYFADVAKYGELGALRRRRQAAR